MIDVLSCGTGGTPTAVDDAIIEAIRGREDDKGYVELNEIKSLKKGDRVRILDGALYDQIGLFETMGDDQRVVIC